MIREKDYLKNFNSMSAKELSQYFTDISQWYEETLPSLLSVTTEWTTSETQAYDAGLKLISALNRTHSFIPIAYRLPVQRRLEEVSGFCQVILQQDTTRTNKAGETSPSASTINTEKPQPPKKTTSVATSQPATIQDNYSTERRPNHYDEWLDKMSPSLREKVADLGNLYACMAHYRQEVEKLASDPKHSEQDLSRASKLAVNYEKQILAIHAAAEIEWAELNGKSVSDDVKSENAKEEKISMKEIAKLESESGTASTSDVSCGNVVKENREWILENASSDMDEDTRAEVLLRMQQILDSKHKLGKKVEALLTSLNILHEDTD